MAHWFRFGCSTRDLEDADRSFISRKSGDSIVADGIELSQLDVDEDQEGIIDMRDSLDLPPEYFTETDTLARQAYFGKFAFKRAARNSLLVRLGVFGTQEVKKGNAHLSTEDVYTKTSDSDTLTTILAVIISVGMFEMSPAMARCGYLSGTLCLLALSLVHHFLCQRLTEIPHFFRQNLATYGDIAKVCFSRSGWRLVVCLLIMNWCGACTVHLTHILETFDQIYCKHNTRDERCIGPQWKVLAGCCLVVVAIRPISALNVRKASRISLYSMLAIAAIEMTCATSHGIAELSSGNRTLQNYTRTGDLTAIGEGVREHMVLGFNGVGILPYVVSEMLTPQNAKRVITKACIYKTLFYGLVAVVCYFGWGDKAMGDDWNPMKGLDSTRFTFAVWMIWFLFIAKTIFTLPLYLWPLCRELDSLLEIEVSPEMELRLPWAIKRVKRHKFESRIVMVVVIMLPTFLPPYDSFKDFVLAVPLNMVQFALPSIFAVGAIVTHLRFLNAEHGQDEHNPVEMLVDHMPTMARECSATRGSRATRLSVESTMSALTSVSATRSTASTSQTPPNWGRGTLWLPQLLSPASFAMRARASTSGHDLNPIIPEEDYFCRNVWMHVASTSTVALGTCCLSISIFMSYVSKTLDETPELSHHFWM